MIPLLRKYSIVKYIVFTGIKLPNEHEVLFAP